MKYLRSETSACIKGSNSGIEWNKVKIKNKCAWGGGKTKYREVFQVFKNAFTLAEILITLGIIGIVSAMTIPTLIANTNSAKFRSQYKKTISVLNQAERMSQAQYGYGFLDASPDCNSTLDNPEEVKTFCAIVNGTLKYNVYMGSPCEYDLGKTIKVQVKIEEPHAPGGYYYRTENTSKYYITRDLTIYQNDYKSDYSGNAYILSDGSIFAIRGYTDGRPDIGYIDVNGIEGPNKEVSCENESDTKLLFTRSSSSDVGTPNTAIERCTVPNDRDHLTDIYPIVLYNSSWVPATNAADYVLKTSK